MQRKLAHEHAERMKRWHQPSPPPAKPTPAPPMRRIVPPKRKLPTPFDQWLAQWPNLSPTLNTRLIVETVADHYGLERHEMLMRSHRQHSVFPRQVAMWLALKLLRDATLPQVGRWFGGFDHTTVMHARDKIERLLGEDHELTGEIETMRQRILDTVNQHEVAS